MLDRLSTQRQRSAHELVQDAVTIYLAPERKPQPIDFFGLLRDFPEDGQGFQDRMRNEWVREWELDHNPEVNG